MSAGGMVGSWGPTPESTPIHSPPPETCGWITVGVDPSERLAALEQSYDFLHAQMGDQHLHLQQLCHQSLTLQLSQALQPASGPRRRRKGLKERNRQKRSAAAVNEPTESAMAPGDASLLSKILVEAATSKALLRVGLHELEEQNSRLAAEVETQRTHAEAMGKEVQMKKRELEALQKCFEEQSFRQHIRLETQRELSLQLLQERPEELLRQVDQLKNEASELKAQHASELDASEHKFQEQERKHVEELILLQKQLQGAAAEVKQLEKINSKHLKQERVLHAQNCHWKKSLAWSEALKKSLASQELASTFASPYPVIGAMQAEAIPYGLHPDLPMMDLLQKFHESDELQHLPYLQKPGDSMNLLPPSMACSPRFLPVPYLNSSLLHFVRPEFRLSAQYQRTRFLRFLRK